MLVDTDILIDFLRGLPASKAFIMENKDDILFSAITEAELLSGKKCDEPREKERTIHLLGLFEKIPVDNPLVQTAGDLRRRYGIETPDSIIAASALHTGSILITRNIRHFNKIEGLVVQRPY